MDRFEVVRLVILGLGWPLLVFGSVRVSLQARRFYRNVSRSSFGRMVVVLVAGLVVTMYSLAVTATAFMMMDPRRGVPIVVPIFAGWMLLMALAGVALGRWTEEAAKVSAVHAKLAESGRVRAEIINRTSHELSTPLTPLLIQVSLLKDPSLGTLTPQQTRAVEVMDRNLARLTSLVREMMDVARLQSGHFEITREPVDLSDLLREAFESFGPAAREGGIDLQGEIEPDLRIEADPIRVAQILQNLLANAIQFTDPGGTIRLVARRGRGQAEVRVEDTGLGFPPSEAARLFQPFTQLAPDRSKQGSVGLGLFVAQSIVEAHGGRIWGRSEGLGRGATFGFALPLVPATPTVPGHPGSASHASAGPA